MEFEKFVVGYSCADNEQACERENRLKRDARVELVRFSRLYLKGLLVVLVRIDS